MEAEGYPGGDAIREIIINIPGMIPRLLTPNVSRKVHWGTIAKAKTELQTRTFYAAVDAKNRYACDNGRIWEPLKVAMIDYLFIVPDKRYIRDSDNQIAGCKYLCDSLQVGMAGIIENDKELTIKSITWEFGKIPKIVIKLRGK